MIEFIKKDGDLQNYKYFSVDQIGKAFFPKATYKDYKRIPDNIHCELIDGVFYMMASAKPDHQLIQIGLASQLYNQLQGKKCRAFTDLDVRLFYQTDESDTTVVRPDIIVVCDETKYRGKTNCEGAPDFIIEIMSDSTEKRDFEEKKAEYEKAGVREYWIVCQGTVHKFLLDDNVYTEYTFNLKQSPLIESSVLNGLLLDFQPILEESGW